MQDGIGLTDWFLPRVPGLTASTGPYPVSIPLLLYCPGMRAASHPALPAAACRARPVIPCRPAPAYGPARPRPTSCPRTLSGPA